MQFQVSTTIESRIDEEMQKKTKRIYKILLCIGIIGIIANIVVAVALYSDKKEPFWLDVELYISALLFALGLVIPLTIKFLTKKLQKTTIGIVNVYEFFDDCLVTVSYRGEEKIAEVKNYFIEITKVLKTENFVFLHLGKRGAYPIEISALTEEQLAYVLNLKKHAA